MVSGMDQSTAFAEPISRRLAAALAKLGDSAASRTPPSVDTTLLAWLEQQGLSAEERTRTIANVLDIPFVEDLVERPAAAEFLERIPIAFARQHCILGFVGEGGHIAAAISDVRSWPQLDVVGRYLGRQVDPLFAPSEQILAAINADYQQQSGHAQQLLESLDHKEVLAEIEELAAHEDLLDIAGRAPVIKLVNSILFEAVKTKASDIHIQPYEDRLVVRLRIDGVLFDAFDVPKGLQEEVLSRIKVMGRMNIAEKRLPQDGRATVQMGDRHVDLRIASLPTSCGERIVLRLLDKSARLYTLTELGMEPKAMGIFQNLIQLEHGLILVTGPTGSGKSTTLYAALQQINTKDRNVLTLEDPIEYQLPGISQTQVSEKKGMTFARGLRSVLRQDPDIIMIGEIRDHETAVMAIQSALTGHLVFSTLHTNDAASAVTRLLDLGIEPYLVASSLEAVLAQRLVRKICGHCRTPFVPSDDDLLRLGMRRSAFANIPLWRGQGCEACRQSGYSGRLGIFELLTVDAGVRMKIQDRANATQIRDLALAHGMRLLQEDGIDKIRAGATTLDEVVRVATRAEIAQDEEAEAVHPPKAA
jgi:general secretion pathway protein E